MSARRKTFGAGRRWLGRADLALSVLLSLYVLALANRIIFRHPLRVDLTRDRIHTLSPATKEILRLVREPVDIVIPRYIQRENPEQEARIEVLSRAQSLLSQYLAEQPLIRIAAEVDVFAEPARWAKIREEYGLSAAQVNRFALFTGPTKEFRQTVTPEDMATFSTAGDQATQRPEIRGFRAEKAITDALARLMRREKKTIYFTQDKGEYALRARSGARQVGGSLQVVARELDTYGFEARPLALGTSKRIPDDCSAIVVAGPSQRFSPEEVDVLRRYLAAGGHLFVALGAAPCGIEPLLEERGAEVLEGSVRGLEILPGSRKASEWVTARTFGADHPVTRPFADAPRFEMYLFSPRAFSGGGSEKGFRSTDLVKTGEKRRVEEGQVAGEESFYLVRDGRAGEQPKTGNFAVALAVEQAVPERPPPGYQRVDTRIVVVGASNFLDDSAFFAGSHRDFLMNSILWLVGEGERTTVGGDELPHCVLPMDPLHRRYYLWIPVGLLPATFLAFAAFVYFLRRA